MRRTLLAALCCLVPAVLAAEPSTAAPARRSTAAAAVRRPDVFGGYSYLRAGEANLHGWHVAGSRPFRRSLRLVADLSGHYGSFAAADLSQLTFLAGVRYSPARPGDTLAPFAHALLGGARINTTVSDTSSSNGAWGGALGAGVDYGLNRRWAARAQVDLLVLRSGGVTDKDPRISLGAVYRFR
jgi:outer membrane protein with beta-barrel domain